MSNAHPVILDPSAALPRKRRGSSAMSARSPQYGVLRTSLTLDPRRTLAEARVVEDGETSQCWRRH